MREAGGNVGVFSSCSQHLPWPSAAALNVEETWEESLSSAAEKRSDGVLVCGRLRPVGRCVQFWEQAR